MRGIPPRASGKGTRSMRQGWGLWDGETNPPPRGERRKRALGDGFFQISWWKTRSTLLLTAQRMCVNVCWEGETGLVLERASGSFLGLRMS